MASRKELREVFDQWNKENNHSLSWLAFQETYSKISDIKDIRKPDDMSFLQLDTGEFSFLLDVPEGITGNAIDYCRHQLFISKETIDRNGVNNEESSGCIDMLTFLINIKTKIIASKTAVIYAKRKEIDMHSATIQQTKRLDKNPDDIRDDIKRLDKDIERLDEDIDAIRAEIKRLDKDIDAIRAEIKGRNNDSKRLREGRIQSVRSGDLTALEKLGHCSSNYTFTNVFDIGMVGRDKELCAVLEKLAEAMGTAVKEDNRPIAIVSAPRQGKSLFLQAVLSLLCPSIEKRPINKVDFKALPTLPEDVVVIPLTLNGTSAEVPKKNKGSATAAANYLWNKVFGLSTSIVSGECAAWLLGRLFPRRQVVLLVDELTKLVEDFREEQNMLQEFARLILSFFGTHTTMVFTGFDVKLSSAFTSASGRLPIHVTLDPIPLHTPSFLELLPLRNLLTSISTFIRGRASKEASDLLLYYELGKSTPGVLGAIAEQQIAGVPILDLLAKKQLVVDALIHAYAVKRAEGSTVFPTEKLGESLLNANIGVLLSDGSVYIPPIFVYAAFQTNSADFATFSAAFNQVVSVLKKWLGLYMTTGKSVDELISDASTAFELFVLASLRMQDTLLRPHNTHTYPEIDFNSRLTTRYPQDPLSRGKSVSGTWLTADGLEAVDIVRVVDDQHQQWVEVKMVSYRPNISRLVSAVKEHVKNVPAGVTSVEYVIVTTVPSRTRFGEDPLPKNMNDRKAELCNLLGDNPDNMNVHGRMVKLTKRIVFMDTSEADTLLSPLVSTIAPSLGAMNGDTCENRLFVGNTNPHWMAIKDEKETNALDLDEETKARLPLIRKRCQLAIKQAEVLQTKYK